MNRIVIIGNGFDLSYGLKTSYGDFIDDYWKRKRRLLQDWAQNGKGYTYEDEDILVENLGIERNKLPDLLSPQVKDQHVPYERYIGQLQESERIDIKNKFLLGITLEKSLQHWVDIEAEYYNRLKDILRQSTPLIPSLGNDNPYTVNQLNAEFERIKKALADYLTGQMGAKQIEKYNLKEICALFNIADFSSHGRKMLKEEYKPTDEKELDSYNARFEDCDDDMSDNVRYRDLAPKEILLLNFNYTDLPDRWYKYFRSNISQTGSWRPDIEKTKIEVIAIHGELNNADNPMVFGYGDEQDDAHGDIEKAGGNYLNNIKTISYLKTPHYKKLLRFIESGGYQIIILGHSCGLSDKTLLHTLFEHENCLSIKPYYYVDEERKSNYSDIVKNIYRVFSDKAMMRDKVVNEKRCKPLSQQDT